ncbi:GGDEF domain-containing protein [Microbacterium sp. A8/3-1]|uniref:GGDEF domain-containing protein n=1 Tax=Microbacterium sp. A8/3-1 TaxID=3160749 RepID=A0AAU7VZU7_9MICO
MIIDEQPEHNMQRVISDHRRVAKGTELIARSVRTAEPGTPVAVIAVDIDGSGHARSLGIEAKIELVQAVRRVVLDTLDGRGVLIDSGTRDELRIVAIGMEPRSVRRLAERLRAQVASTAIDVAGTGPRRYTVSIGVAQRRVPTDGLRLIAAANSALGRAKRRKNAVSSLPGLSRPVLVSDLRSGRSRAAAVRAVGQSLIETVTAWGPVWYWTQGHRSQWATWPPRPATMAERALAPDLWDLIEEITALRVEDRPGPPNRFTHRRVLLWVDSSMLRELDKIARQRSVHRRNLLNDAAIRAARKD